MALHCTMSYFGEEERSNGMPDPWFHYLVVASDGHKVGSGVASIMSLSESRAAAVAQGASLTLLSQTGGPAAALKEAEAFLDRRHPDLKKIVSTPKP